MIVQNLAIKSMVFGAFLIFTVYNVNAAIYTKPTSEWNISKSLRDLYQDQKLILESIDDSSNKYENNVKQIQLMIKYVNNHFPDCDVKYYPKNTFFRHKQISKGIDNIKFNVNFTCQTNTQPETIHQIELHKTTKDKLYEINFISRYHFPIFHYYIK